MTAPGPRTALEFFAGIGLARMGLERAGWNVVFANDIDPKKKEMHEGNWGPDDAYLLADVYDLAPTDIPSAALAWASFPCVDLSLAGNRAGLNGSESSAYWGFYQLLQRLDSRRPPLVVLENVPGMLTSHGGRDIEVLLRSLADLGYAIDILEVDASRFVPQSRSRLFVLGAAGAAPTACALTRTSPFRTTRVRALRERHAGLPWFDAPVGPAPSRTVALGDLMERFPEDADIWWPEEATHRLVSQMSSRHAYIVRSAADANEVSFATIYRRMRPAGYRAEVRHDGIAGCLRTPRGGSSRQFVLELGKGKVRARHMTAIEYGRLQGAQDFKIRVPELQALYGFGDAVCVPAVEWIASWVLNPLAESIG